MAKLGESIPTLVIKESDFSEGRIFSGIQNLTFNLKKGFFAIIESVNFLYDNKDLPNYTVSTLPSASTKGKMIYVTDEAGGEVPAFSDGTNWRRVTDRAIVS